MVQCCKISHFSLKKQENFDQFARLAVLCNQYSYAVFVQFSTLFTTGSRLKETFCFIFGGAGVFLKPKKCLRRAEKGLFSPTDIRSRLKFLIFDLVFYSLPRFYSSVSETGLFFTRLQDLPGQVAGLGLTGPATDRIFSRTYRHRMQEKLAEKGGKICQHLPVRVANSALLLELRKKLISVFRLRRRRVC